jgi:hypothetical protein
MVSLQSPQLLQVRIWHTIRVSDHESVARVMDRRYRAHSPLPVIVIWLGFRE